MRTLSNLAAFVALSLGTSGCTSHLVFTESSTMGLRAKVSFDSATPYELSLGYDRGVLAFIPVQKGTATTPKPDGQSKRDEKAQDPPDDETPPRPERDKPAGDKAAGGKPAADKPAGDRAGADVATPPKPVTARMTIEHDPTELMSVYSVFNANLGFNDPVEVRHLLVTGRAAHRLLADSNKMRKFVYNVQDIVGTPTSAPKPAESKK